MWIPQHLRERFGRLATIAAAVLVFAMETVPALFPGWLGLERQAGVPGLVAVALIALSLLDRFRPARWFLLVSLPIAWVSMAVMAASYGNSSLLAFQVACATLAWVLLNSAPAREYFGTGQSRVEGLFLRRRGEDAALAPGDTARAWDDREGRFHDRELASVGGRSREPPPAWWVNP